MQKTELEHQHNVLSWAGHNHELKEEAHKVKESIDKLASLLSLQAT
jgi:hypothetical protein